MRVDPVFNLGLAFGCLISMAAIVIVPEFAFWVSMGGLVMALVLAAIGADKWVH